MQSVAIVIIVAVFIALLFLNIYFRVKVLKHYKVLVKNRIEFDARHILSKTKMEDEILPKYPEHKEHIKAFAENIRFSVRMAILLIALITILAMIIRNGS